MYSFESVHICIGTHISHNKKSQTRELGHFGFVENVKSRQSIDGMWNGEIVKVEEKKIAFFPKICEDPLSFSIQNIIRVMPLQACHPLP